MLRPPRSHAPVCEGTSGTLGVPSTASGAGPGWFHAVERPDVGSRARPWEPVENPPSVSGISLHPHETWLGLGLVWQILLFFCPVQPWKWIALLRRPRESSTARNAAFATGSLDIVFHPVRKDLLHVSPLVSQASPELFRREGASRSRLSPVPRNVGNSARPDIPRARRLCGGHFRGRHDGGRLQRRRQARRGFGLRRDHTGCERVAGQRRWLVPDRGDLSSGGSAGSPFTGAQGHTIAAADFNGDGKLDLAIISGNSAKILLGNGDGTFQSPLSVVLGVSPTRFSAADVNGDGHIDLLAANTNGTVSVLLGNGDGTFAPAVSYVAGIDAQDVKAVDLNGDGKLDLVVANGVSAGSVNVLLGNGDGTFQPYHAYVAYSAPYELVVGDFNGDGYMDVAVANSYTSSAITVLPGNGDGTLGLYHSYNVYTQPWDIETGDFNNDGHPDLIEGNGSAGYEIETGNGDGTFAATQLQAAQSGSRFAVGDFNGDGATDIAGTAGAGSVSVLINSNNGLLTLAGATQLQVAAAGSTVAGVPLTLTVSALNAAGNPATGYLGTVLFSSSDVQAGLPASYSFTAADAGTHTFSVALKSSGTQTLSVSDSQVSSLTGSQAGIVVTPAPAARFTLSNPRTGMTGPSVTTAGVAQNFSVTAMDGFGNIATGYLGTVTVSSSDVQAVLPASYTFTAADAGTAWFSETLKTVGTQTLTVRDTTTATLVSSEAVLVTSSAPSTFSVTGGAGAAGVSRVVTIVARDSYGNFVPAYSGTVHLTSSDANAVLPADTALINGTATVNVRMMTVGTQSLTATDTANTALTATETIAVTPATVAGFDVTGFPGTVAGIAHSFTITVRNTLGQVMTGYTGTVNFASSDTQAGLPASYTFTSADKGSHNFTATLKTAGLQSISAWDSVNGAATGMQSGINVTAAAATSLVISGYPATVAGAAHSFTVAAKDAYGNGASSYTGTVKFSSTDAQASLPLSYRFTSADAGVHVFTATFKTAAGTQNVGGQTLSVQDASNPALLGTQTNIIVSNAAMSNFALSVPSNIAPGTPFALKVIAQDDFGNKVNNYQGTIHFTNTAGSTGMPADYTFTSADNGQHSFTITLATTGVQTISLVDVVNALLKGSVTLSVGGTVSGGGGGGGGGSGGGGSGGGGGRVP